MWIQVVLITYFSKKKKKKGCTNHICNSLQGFQETRKLNEGELSLTLTERSRIPVVVVGVFNLCFDSRVLILEDCLYVPNVRKNLISATNLGKHGDRKSVV